MTNHKLRILLPLSAIGSSLLLAACGGTIEFQDK